MSSDQLSLNKFLDPSTPSMRKVDDGRKKKKKRKKKRILFLVATTSLPAVDIPNDDRWNAARSCQYSLTVSMVRVAEGIVTISLTR